VIVENKLEAETKLKEAQELALSLDKQGRNSPFLNWGVAG
jgi:hypothetical protein